MGKTLTSLSKANNSPVMAGHHKITTEELIANYPVVTLTAVDIVNGANGEYPVFNFKENASLFFAGGEAAKNVVKKWREVYSVAQINDELAQNPLQVKIYKAISKKGREFTQFEVIG